MEDKEILSRKREKAIVLTSSIGIGGNALLVAFKVFVGILAGSISIIVDAVNNLTDALSSLLTIIGAKLSNKKPDKKHPFGYGRVEYLSAMMIAVLILLAGGTAIVESVKSIIAYFQEGEMASYDLTAFLIIAAAIAVKITLGLFFKIRGKQVKSEALSNSGTDALMDSVLSLSTLIGALIGKYANVYVEGYLGCAIGCFILYSGFKALKESLSSIIGERVDKDTVDGLKKLILSHKEVKGVYDLILNSYGVDRVIASAHMELDDNMTAKEIHKLTRTIQAEAYKKYRFLLTLGIYASNESCPKAKAIKEDLAKLVYAEPHIIQMHGYYLDEETSTVTFDVIFSYEEKDPASKIKAITAKLKEKYPEINFYPVLDRDFSEEQE